MRTLNYRWDDIPMKLNIIYRLCDQRPNTYYNNISKSECLNNFIDVFGKTNLTIIADNCRNIKEISKIGCKIITTNLGNSQSFAKALDLALELNDNEFVYLVEDDYFHKKESPKILLEGLAIREFVSLYDHPDKYGENSPNKFVRYGGELSRVLLGKSCHWKETNSTTMTFACKVSTLRKYHEVMRKYLDSFVPKDYLMWRDILNNANGLITPLPGYATHLHSSWLSPLFNWDELIK